MYPRDGVVGRTYDAGLHVSTCCCCALEVTINTLNKYSIRPHLCSIFSKQNDDIVAYGGILWHVYIEQYPDDGDATPSKTQFENGLAVHIDTSLCHKREKDMVKLQFQSAKDNETLLFVPA